MGSKDRKTAPMHKSTGARKKFLMWKVVLFLQIS